MGEATKGEATKLLAMLVHPIELNEVIFNSLLVLWTSSRMSWAVPVLRGVCAVARGASRSARPAAVSPEKTFFSANHKTGALPKRAVSCGAEQLAERARACSA